MVVKPCRFVKPVPLVLTANTVPLPLVPPLLAVPYRMLLDNTKPPFGLAPSLLVKRPRPFVAPAEKLYRFVKPVPLVLTANTVPKPELPPTFAVPYRMLLDKTKPPFGLAPSLLV